MVRVKLSIFMHQVGSLDTSTLQVGLVNISTFAVYLRGEHRVVLFLNSDLCLLFLVCVKESFPLEREIHELFVDRMYLRIAERKSSSVYDAVQNLNLVNN